MTRDEFLNRLRSLFNLDVPPPDLNWYEWNVFLADPARYLMKADDATADAIWREVEKRQTKEHAA